MANWKVRAALSIAPLSLAGDKVAAEVAARALLAVSLPTWTVDRIDVQESFGVGDWVIAKRAGAAPDEYARIAQGATELQVEFGNAVRRPLATIVSRV